MEYCYFGNRRLFYTVHFVIYDLEMAADDQDGFIVLVNRPFT